MSDRRRLVVFRHAKSARPPGIDDHERPLAPRGIVAAPLMGQFLAEAGLVPDRALVSTARRTRETYALAATHWPRPPEMKAEPRIYEASLENLVNVLRQTPAAIRTLMLVGHNPGSAKLAMWLTNEAASDADAVERLYDKFPTAGVAVLEFDDNDWSRVQPGEARLVSFTTPRMLGGVDED